MGVITDILDQVDGAIETVGQEGYVSLAGAVGDVISIGATVALMVLGVNAVMQVRPMSMATFFAFGMKVALIGIFAQSWSNFDVVYQIVTDVPESIGAALLGLSGLSDTAGLYNALDAMLSRMTEYGDEIGENAGWVAGAVMTALFYFIAALFAAVAAGIIAYAKILLTLMVILAPLMIACSLFAVTNGIFQSWTRSLVGYAFMPIAAAGAVGVVLAIGTDMASAIGPEDVVTISTILPFMAVLVLSIGIMAAVPMVASNLSGAFGLASNAAGLNRFAQFATMGAGYAAFRMGRQTLGHAGRGGEWMTERAKSNLDQAGSAPPRVTPNRQLDLQDRLRPAGSTAPASASTASTATANAGAAARSSPWTSQPKG